MRKITLLPFLMLVLAACGVTTPSSSTPTSTPSTTSASTTSTATSTSSSSASSTPSSSSAPVSSVISIQDARQRVEGADVSVRGVVTRVVRQKNFFIQQGDFAITVFGYEGSETIVPGDFVEVYGFISAAPGSNIGNSLIQISGAAGSGLPEVTKLTGTAPTITPLELTESTYDSDALRQNNDGRLISIKGLKLPAAFTPLVIDQTQQTGNLTATFKLGAKNVDARFDRYINVPGREAINTFFNGMSTTTKFDYVGILGEFNSAIQLQVSDDSDFALNTDPAVLPTAITVTSPATPVEVVVGLELQLGTTVLPENADDKSVTWSSGDTAIATVSSAGLVSGVSVGTAVITATSVASNLVTGTISVTVTPAPLTLAGVEFGVGDQSLKVGQSIDSEANLLPLGYVGQGITYTSSDTAVATVTSSGVIEARAAGTSMITVAATEDATKTDTLSVTVSAVDTIASVKLATVTSASNLTPVSVNGVITRILSQTQFFVQDATGPIQVFGTSGMTDLAVNDYINITGAVTIYGGFNQIGSFTGTGTSALPQIPLRIQEVSFLTAPIIEPLSINSSQYNTTFFDASKVGSLVRIEGLKPSSSWTDLSASGSTSRTLTLDGTNVSMRIESSFSSDNRTLVNNIFKDFWKNDTVTYIGILNGFNTSLQLALSSATDFTLVEAAPVSVESISVTSAGSLTSIAEGVTLQLSATVLPSNADVLTVTWASSDVLKATVTETGLVTAIAAGTVDITATSTSDPLKFGTFSLTITPPPASLEAIEIVATKTQLETSETLQLSINYLPLGYAGLGVTWSSNNSVLATVSVTGLVTALAVGSVTITAESTENTAFKDTIDFTIVEPFKNIVMNEVYGAGGNNGATYTHDFVELYNPNDYEIDISGYTFYYASATGPSTGAYGKNTLPANSKISAKGFYLVLFASGLNGVAVPNANHTFTTLPLNFAGAAGKLFLATDDSINHTSTNTLPSSVKLMDFLGFGVTATAYEGTGAAAAPSTTNSTQRKTDGLDTNNNASDFAARVPTPGATNNLPL